MIYNETSEALIKTMQSYGWICVKNTVDLLTFLYSCEDDNSQGSISLDDILVIVSNFKVNKKIDLIYEPGPHINTEDAIDEMFLCKMHPTGENLNDLKLNCPEKPVSLR